MICLALVHQVMLSPPAVKQLPYSTHNYKHAWKDDENTFVYVCSQYDVTTKQHHSFSYTCNNSLLFLWLWFYVLFFTAFQLHDRGGAQGGNLPESTTGSGNNTLDPRYNTGIGRHRPYHVITRTTLCWNEQQKMLVSLRCHMIDPLILYEWLLVVQGVL